jgi:hypothetical protein
MPRHRREVFAKVADQLFQTEASVDTALAQASALLGAIPAARVDAHLSATVGQDAFDRVVAAITALNDARREMVAAHHAFHQVQKDCGLAEVNFGGYMKPYVAPAEARLKVVKSAAA